jgi:hypothetical protein
MFNLHVIERALDTGRVQVQAVNGKWYTCRRNGRTKLWVTSEYRIPIKWAFANCACIDAGSFDRADFRIAPATAPIAAEQAHDAT